MKRSLLVLVFFTFLFVTLSSCNAATQPTAETSPSGSNLTEQTPSATDTVSAETSESQTVFYISPSGSDSDGTGTLENPWQTVTKARDHIRTINSGMTSDIFVYLREGTYTVENPITFMKDDSGKNGFIIHYENYAGETPIISGGKEITGWELYDPSKNIYRAKVEPGDQFRQLYINGQRAILARTPNLTDEAVGGPYYLGGKWNYLNQYDTKPYPKGPYTFQIETANVPECDNSSPLELVTVDHWRYKMARIAGFDVKGSSTTVNLEMPESDNGIFSHGNQYRDPIYSPYYFQNSPDLLDAEGEWYFDRTENEVYYKPRAGDDMATAYAIAPKAETIINLLDVSSGEGVSNLAFKGLTVEYSNWTAPDNFGYANWQAAVGIFKNDEQLMYLPGAVQLKNADNILIEGCTIRHTGANAIVALDISDLKVSDCLFKNNTITDTSAGGIFLILNNDRSTGNVIENNLVSYGGRQYADAAGILAACTPDVKIFHNEVCFYGYGGISFGFDWGDSTTSASNIEVAYNKVHDVMQLVDDCAGIYSLGNIPGGTVHDNYIYNITPSDYQGGNPICAIDNDSGCGKTFYSNVIENTGYAFSAVNFPNHDNIFKDNFYNCEIGHVSDDNTMTDNIFVDGAWPESAQKIINFSGIIN